MIRGDATQLPLPDASVACVVTSPPYNVGINYPGYTDNMPWELYRNMAYESLREMYRVLVPGGRAWINVQAVVPKVIGDNESRMDLLSLWSTEAEDAGFLYRDTVCWVQDSHDGSCAWGSWLRPSAPNLRGSWEAVLLVYKEHWARKPPKDLRRYVAPRFYPEEPNEDWTDLVRNVWKIAPRRNTGYPATYPLVLPSRAIRLSTWPSELVLDPFAGSGTTVQAAEALGRMGVGIDICG